MEEKVIVVPGIFFDLNPSRRRDLFDSPCHHFVRLSYGPKMDVLKMGLDGIERVVNKYVLLPQLHSFRPCAYTNTRISSLGTSDPPKD